MKNIFAVILITLLLAGMASASTTVLNRMDYFNEQEAQTVAVFTPKFDFWGFNVNNAQKADYEVGKELQITGKLKAGGTVAYFPGKNEFDLVPSLIYKTKIGAGTLTVHGGMYIPLNGKPTMLFSRETSLTYKVSKSLEAGLAGTYSHTAGKTEVAQVGLMAKLTKGPIALKLRWLAPNDGAPTKVRVETFITF